MKTSRTRFAFLLAALSISSFGVVARVQSQTPATSIAVAPPSAQFVVHRVLDDALEATLTIPRAWLPTQTKARIALYETGRSAIAAESKRTFQVVGDRLQTRLRLEIAPGNYEIRLVRDDKTRTPFSPPVAFTINGLRREPGAWLFNGSMFVNRNEPIQNAADAQNAAAPLFVAGLKRDLSQKAKKASRSIYTNAPLSWRVLEVEAGEIAAANYDFAGFQTRLQQQVADAQASGQRNYSGVVLKSLQVSWTTASDEKSVIALRNAMTRVRQIVNTLAPNAALILSVDNFLPFFEPQIIETGAPLFDAVVMERDSSDAKSAWVIKMLRRAAEEQPNYDLPIFVKTTNRINSASQLEALMSGATSLIEYSNDDLQRVLRRNSSLFVNAVTIEDIGVLPSDFGSSDAQLANELRNIGRIPLVARLLRKDEKKAPPEAFLLRVGASISLDTVERLRANIERGVRVYIEGTPRFGDQDAELKKQWEQIVGGVSTPLPDDAAPIRDSTVRLDDLWTFGVNSGATIRVQREGTIAINAATLANRTKTEKGVDVITAPRVLATLEDDSPALILGAVGKGQVLWMPHRVLDVSNVASRAYYDAIAAQVQSGLVTLRDENGAPLSTSVRAALRRSPKGALMLALFNPNSQVVKLRATLEGIAAVALDLENEAEMTIEKQGNQSTVATSIPANGWKIIAFGAERKAFDAERNAPLFPAKIK